MKEIELKNKSENETGFSYDFFNEKYLPIFDILNDEDNKEKDYIPFFVSSELKDITKNQALEVCEKEVAVELLYHYAKEALRLDLYKPFIEKSSTDFLEMILTFDEYGYTVADWLICDGFVSPQLTKLVVYNNVEMVELNDQDFDSIYFHLKSLNWRTEPMKVKLYEKMLSIYKSVMSMDHGRKLLHSQLSKSESEFKQAIANGKGMIQYLKLRKIVHYSLNLTDDNAECCADTICKFIEENVTCFDDTVPYDLLILDYPEKFFAIKNPVILEIKEVYNKLKPAFNTFYEVKVDKSRLKLKDGEDGYKKLLELAVINNLDKQINCLEDIDLLFKTTLNAYLI